MTRTNLAKILLLIAVLTTSTGPIIAKITVLNPFIISFYRVFLSLIPILICRRFSKIPNFCSKKELYKYKLLSLIAGGLLGIDIALFYVALEYTKATNATIIVNLAPLLVLIVSKIVNREAFNKLLSCCLVLIALGIYLLVKDNVIFQRTNIAGVMIAFIAAICYASYIVIVKRIGTSSFNPIDISLWSAIGSVLVCLLFCMFCAQDIFKISSNMWPLLIFNAWVAQFLGQYFFAWSIKYLSLSFSSLQLMLQPALVLILSWYFLNESLTITQSFGLVLISLAAYVSVTKIRYLDNNR